MFCRNCQYDLGHLQQEKCPECGRRFDPEKPRTFQKRRRRFQPLVGLGFAFLIGALVIIGYWLSFQSDFGYSRFAALYTVAGIGLFGGIVTALLAAWNRSWWGRAPLLFSGFLCIWSGLALGGDKYFRVWQSMPNAPDRAYSDAGAMVPFLVGWIPGGLIVGVVFGLTLLVLMRCQRPPRESN